MNDRLNRRNFVAATAAAGAALAIGAPAVAAGTDKPALLGGSPVRKKAFPSWPIQGPAEEKAMLTTLRSGSWYRTQGKTVSAFEDAYKDVTGAKHCLATSSGTTALITAMGALDIGPGDEVIVTPYTFIASLTSIMAHFALPVLVDIDPETCLLDPAKIEAAITDRTVAIMPVHIGGNVCDMDAVLAVAKKHNLLVIEDACQAHLAEWRGRKVGTLGTAGCFSFQMSKNLCSGEGGAVLTDDGELIEKLYAFHNNCRPKTVSSYNFTYMSTRAANFRMTEFQGALLQAQMTRLEQNAKTRDANAKYLTGLLKDIPGLAPAKMYDGCTRNAWHLFMCRYKPKEFAGLSRDKFLKALGAEGISASGGYGNVAWDKFIQESYATRGAQRVYPKKTLADWAERYRVPEYEKLCNDAVWFTQTMLLGPRGDMDDIAAAVRKIHANAEALAKS
jgi:perosamine synthetase